MVTNSLGRMTVQLDSMINEVYKMEIEKKESELESAAGADEPSFPLQLPLRYQVEGAQKGMTISAISQDFWQNSTAQH